MKCVNHLIAEKRDPQSVFLVNELKQSQVYPFTCFIFTFKAVQASVTYDAMFIERWVSSSA